MDHPLERSWIDKLLLQDQTKKFQDLKENTHNNILNALKLLHNAELARKSQTNCQLKAQHNIKEVLGKLETLYKHCEKQLSNLSADYQQDINTIIKCYKEEKSFFKTQLETEIEKNVKLSIDLKKAEIEIDKLKNS